MGRFISADTFIPDPTDPQTFNRYTYANNNPVTFVDPTGNFAFLAFFIAAVINIATAAAIGAAISIGIGAVTGNIRSWEDLGRFAATGATAGATFATGAILLGPAASASFFGQLSLFTAAGAMSGGVDAELGGGSFGQGAKFGAILGAAGFGAGKILGPVVRPLTNRLGQSRLGQAFKRLVSPVENLLKTTYARTQEALGRTQTATLASSQATVTGAGDGPTIRSRVRVGEDGIIFVEDPNFTPNVTHRGAEESFFQDYVPPSQWKAYTGDTTLKDANFYNNLQAVRTSQQPRPTGWRQKAIFGISRITQLFNDFTKMWK